MADDNATEEFNPYQTLNVNPDASVDEITESFKNLSKTFHPDRNAAQFDAKTLAASREKFEAISRAKDILCDKQTRQAYDEFGVRGIEMLQRDIYTELKSLKIGKKYRNDDAVRHLLKYYIKREATVELDKLVSAYGHCELTLDSRELYGKFVDVLLRNETIPSFISSVYNGIPTIEIVLNEDNPLQLYNEPVRIVDDDYDFDSDDMDIDIDIDMDIDDNNDLSVSELMSLSIDDQLEILNEALSSGDTTILKNLPVGRQSIKPSIDSFLMSIGYQYEYNNNNLFTLSTMNYISDIINTNNSNKLYHNINIEWQNQFNRYTKLINQLSFGISTFSSKHTISRNIDDRTTFDISLYFNFLDNFWNNFTNLFQSDYGSNKKEEMNAAQLFDNMLNENQPNNRFFDVFPEIFTVCKNGIICLYNLFKNGSNVIYHNVLNGYSLYPGFDLSFSIKRILFNEWYSISSIRLGRMPSISWNILKKISKKQFDLSVDINSAKNINLKLKHNRVLDKRFQFYIMTQFNMEHIINISCGFTKILTDDYINEIIDDYTKIDEYTASNIDCTASCGIGISLRNGLLFTSSIKRGASSFSIPIKLTDSPIRSENPIKIILQMLFGFSIPILTFYGYKLYKKYYSKKITNNRMIFNLNDDGKLLFNKREFALKQQLIINRESKQIRIREINDDNGLVILCSFYGNNIEFKLFNAIRKYFKLDQDDDDNDDEKKEQNNNDTDDDNNDDEKREIEEKSYFEQSTNGSPVSPVSPIPPLLFNTNKNKNKKTPKISEKYPKNDNKKYIIKLSEIDWFSIQNDLENILRNSFSEDISLLSFLNVTNVLQYMVKNNKLILTSGTKIYLPGFYDCCNDDKLKQNELIIIYKYKNNIKYCTISDVFPLKLPNNQHLEWFNCRLK